METGPWRYAVQIFDADGSPVVQVPVTIDWEPAEEWLRFTALRRGETPAVALGLECRIEPVWDPVRRQPYVAGVRACPEDGRKTGLTADIPDDYFNPAAQAAVVRLVEAGRLEAGAPTRYLAVAFAEDVPVHRSGVRFRTRTGPPALALAGGSLDGFISLATASLGSRTESDHDFPVFLPEEVLQETGALASAAEARETGGVLIGHLHRDHGSRRLFVEVTAQVPARHVDASVIHLTFTSDTWTEIRAALADRRRGEIMLGYWHSHPVRAWCARCPVEERARCPLRADFYSPEDRHLHRTIFPRAYSIALVVNDVGPPGPTYSMFGWRDGLIAARSFRMISPALAAVEALHEH